MFKRKKKHDNLELAEDQIIPLRCKELKNFMYMCVCYGLRSLPASDAYIEAANDVVFFFRKTTMLNIGTEIIQPSEAAALPTSLKALTKTTHAEKHQFILNSHKHYWKRSNE